MDGDFKKTPQSFELPQEDLEALFESTFAKMNGGISDEKAGPQDSERGSGGEAVKPEEVIESIGFSNHKASASMPHFRPLKDSSDPSSESKAHIEEEAGFPPPNPEARATAGGTITKEPIPESKNRHPEALAEGSSRKKTSLRQRYEEEAEKIQAEIGDIEAVRMKLGLSKRKICQLLMIDPSAWTRWTKGQSSVPPHIYRSLQWYMILQEKHPEYRSSIWLNAVAQPTLSEKEIQSLQEKIIEGSKTEITQKAIHYLAEEDHKRNRLELRLTEKIKKAEHGREPACSARSWDSDRARH